MLLLGAVSLALTKPEEGALAMLLVLMVFAYIHISVRINFAPHSLLLVVGISALVVTSVTIDCHSLIKTYLPVPCFCFSATCPR
jgi:hypothetical protein